MRGQKLPPDVRALCVAMVQGHDRRRHSLTPSRKDRACMEAVENALALATADIRSVEVREKLKQGLLLSVKDRKRWPYERLDLPTVSRNDFYRRKTDFLAALAGELGYMPR